MAAKSNHPGDLSSWIVKIVENCKNFQQLECAMRVRTLYENKLRDSSMSFKEAELYMTPIRKAIHNKIYEL